MSGIPKGSDKNMRLLKKVDVDLEEDDVDLGDTVEMIEKLMEKRLRDMFVSESMVVEHK
jgi:hypothetical protein